MGVIVSGTQDLQIASNQTMGADGVTARMEIRGFTLISVQLVWTGADQITSYFIPEVSNDGANWCQLVTTSSATRADSAAGCCIYSYEVNYAFFRVAFFKSTNTTGTFSAFCLASGLGPKSNDH